jgi:hypothetical protein
MAEFAIHNVVKVEMCEVREHSDFSTRTIVITDDKGNRHEVSLYSRSENEDALKVLM